MSNSINILKDVDESSLGNTIWDLCPYSYDKPGVTTSVANIGMFSDGHSHRISYRSLNLASTKKIIEIFERTNNELNILHCQNYKLNERMDIFERYVAEDVNRLKHALAEIIALCQQQGRFIQQLTAMLEATEALMKQQEELATQSEAQYLAVKQKLKELNKKQQENDVL